MRPPRTKGMAIAGEESRLRRTDWEHQALTHVDGSDIVGNAGIADCASPVG